VGLGHAPGHPPQRRQGLGCSGPLQRLDGARDPDPPRSAPAAESALARMARTRRRTSAEAVPFSASCSAPHADSPRAVNSREAASRSTWLSSSSRAIRRPSRLASAAATGGSRPPIHAAACPGEDARRWTARYALSASFPARSPHSERRPASPGRASAAGFALSRRSKPHTPDHRVRPFRDPQDVSPPR